MNRRLTTFLAGRLVAAVFALATAPFALAGPAQPSRGSFQYASAQQCDSDRKIPAEFCANAEANARAEFDEKAPRFASREACEQSFGRGKCSLGFGAAEGASGKARAVHFSPRLDVFIVKVNGERDMSVLPQSASLRLDARTILRRDTHINPRIAAQAHKPVTAPLEPPVKAAAAGGNGGLDTPHPASARPASAHGPFAAAPAPDPNFDCAAVLEPSPAGVDAGVGCYPAHRKK